MPNASAKVLHCATECFFQHGYTAANISMISRYSGVSRVTIHKQFTSKEVLFRAVVQNYLDESIEKLNEYKSSKNDFWQDTETMILFRCEGLFDEISSSLIRADLMRAGQEFCKDIIQAKEIIVREYIKLRILKEISEEQLTLEKINMSAEELSMIIESTPLAIAVSVFEEDNKRYVQNMISIFKSATLMG